MADNLNELRATLATALGLRPDTRAVRMADIGLEFASTDASGLPTKVILIKLGKERALIRLEDAWVHEATEFVASARRANIRRARQS